MRLPPLEEDTSHLGNWIEPADVEHLIPVLAHTYYQRYACWCYSDADDFEQEGRLALWLYLKEKGNPDRVRELEAIGRVTTAIRGAVESTKRSGVGMLSSQEDGINWRVLAAPDRQLTKAQAETLDSFRLICSQKAGTPYWTALWLVEAAGFTPEMVTAYFRSRERYRKRVPPAMVLKWVAKAKANVRKYLDREWIDIVNQISLCEW